MSVNPGQAVSAAVTNAAFISKTDETASNEASGIVRLNNTSDSESGPSITNIQKRMNDNKFITQANQNISASGTITATLHGNQYLRVAGDGTAITTSSTPFGTGAFEDGLIIRVVGTDNTNTVTIGNNDASKGCVLNGEALLKKYYILELQFDSVLDRFIEIGRNW